MMPQPFRECVQMVCALAAIVLFWFGALLVIGLPAALAVVLVLRWYEWLQAAL